MGASVAMNSKQVEHNNSEEIRYVRVTSREREGFVEFNFSVGDPSLFLEMILPIDAYEEFCTSNKVKSLTSEQEQMVDRHESVWYNSVAGESPDLDPQNY